MEFAEACAALYRKIGESPDARKMGKQEILCNVNNSGFKSGGTL
jgi:hypothetical protein